jgi:predicted dehydrogenase
MALSFGFIGAGNINRTHLKSAQSLGINLAAVADVNLAAAQEAKKTFNVANATADWRQMLADKSIDAVIIGTPNKFHAEQAIASLQAGKHVFLEKPMAMNVKESDAIIAAMRKARKIVQMGMVNRFKGAAQALKKFVEAGKCGHVYSGQAFWYRRRGIPGFGGWFTTKAMSGGGALIDIGVHLLDLALYLMDFPRPVAVSGQTYNMWKDLDSYTYTSMWGKPTPGGKKDVDDYALAVIRFDKGQTLQLNISWALNVEFMQPEMGVRLMGDKGGVALLGGDNPRFFGEEAGHIVDVQPYFTKNDPALDEIKHFAECIEQGGQPMATAQQGRTVQMLLDAIYKSGEEQKEVRLDVAAGA